MLFRQKLLKALASKIPNRAMENSILPNRWRVGTYEVVFFPSRCFADILIKKHIFIQGTTTQIITVSYLCSQSSPKAVMSASMVVSPTSLVDTW